MLPKLIVLIPFVLISCAHSTSKTETKKAPAITTKVVDDKNRKPTQEEEPATVPAAQNGSDERFETDIRSGRKLNIPENQEDVATRCEQDFQNLPENLKSSTTSYPIYHRAIKISYNMKHRLPNWVYYSINRSNLMNSCAKRQDKFRGDSVLVAAQVPKELIMTDSSYKNSGFDRGHMAPSADFTWDQDINSETFFMTNMSPQTAELNQKTWNNLEMHVRDWACGLGEIKNYIGPIIDQNMKRLNSCISVPFRFFRVLQAVKDKKPIGIAFVYHQNDGTGDPYRQKAISIRKLEEMTGINFFKDDYAQAVQDQFETAFDVADWEQASEKCQGCAANSGGGKQEND